MRILLAGSIGRLPVGGHAWVDLQYLLGFQALGHDVYYLEECGEGSYVYDWESEAVRRDLEFPAGYVDRCLCPYGFGERWIYRAGMESLGMDCARFREVCATADLMIVRAAPVELWRDEYSLPRFRVYVDADPGFTQFALAAADPDLSLTVSRCERLFTIGQRIGSADCPIPTLGREWIKTLAPVSLPHWPVSACPSPTHFSTVMQWRSYKDVEYAGALYGNKDREFPKFAELPRLTDQRLRLALTGADPEELAGRGWDVVCGWSTSYDPASYQDFVSNSRAEFAVAKHGYVASRGGWFSDRSACYLACGRPVLVQDTGLADWLPIGAGVVAFTTLEEAVDGIRRINADYSRHRRGARAVAEEVFAASKVLPRLLEAAVNG